MDVDTRLLRYFSAAATEGNLSRAAEGLFVSQPALTKQIRRLESQLGVRLFTRSRAGMTLTAAGQALADRGPARPSAAPPAGPRLAARAHSPSGARWDEPFVAAPADTGAWRDWWLAVEER